MEVSAINRSEDADDPEEMDESASAGRQEGGGRVGEEEVSGEVKEGEVAGVAEGELTAGPPSPALRPSRSSSRLRDKAKDREGRMPYRTRRGYKYSCGPNCNCCSHGESRWSEVEKRQLLSGLRRFGSRRLDKVVSEVPTKTRELIQKKVTKDKRKLNYMTETQWRSMDGVVTVLDSGEKYGKGKIRLDTLDLPDATPQGEIVEVEKKRTRHSPIEQWVEVVEGVNRGQRECSLAVPSVLNWIADMEPQPEPAHCGGVDYPAIYRYLALLCQGEAPPDLDPATSRRVSLLLPALDLVLGQMDLSKATQYLEYYRGPFSKYRYEETFNFADPEVRAVEDLAKVPGMNTLGFHAEMLVSRKLPRLDIITNSLHDVGEGEENVTDDEEDLSDDVEDEEDT